MKWILLLISRIFASIFTNYIKHEIIPTTSSIFYCYFIVIQWFANLVRANQRHDVHE